MFFSRTTLSAGPANATDPPSIVASANAVKTRTIFPIIAIASEQKLQNPLDQALAFGIVAVEVGMHVGHARAQHGVGLVEILGPNESRDVQCLIASVDHHALIARNLQDAA